MFLSEVVMQVWIAKLTLLIGIVAMIAIRAPHGRRCSQIKVVQSERGKLETVLLTLMWFGTVILPLLWIATPLLSFADYRPHSSLGYLTPIEFAARCTASAPKLLSAMPQATSPLQQCSGFTQPVLS